MDMLASSVMSTPNKGRDDDIIAKVSEGEYVIPADVVAMIGDGNTKAGAEALNRLVDGIRQNYKGNKAKPVDFQAVLGKQKNAPKRQGGQRAQRPPRAP